MGALSPTTLQQMGQAAPLAWNHRVDGCGCGAALDHEAQELYTLKVMAVSGSKAELGQQVATATREGQHPQPE